MIHRPLVLIILCIYCLFLSACDSNYFNSESRLGRAFAALNGDTSTETTLFFTQNISLLQQLQQANTEMTLQLKNIWLGEQNSPQELRHSLNTADKALMKLELATRQCSISASTSPLRESVVLLENAWKQQVINAKLSLSVSQHLLAVRIQLQELQRQSSRFTKVIMENTALLSDQRPSRESSTMFYLFTYILSKSAELEQRLQKMLSSNVMSEKQLKRIMRSRTNVNQILRGMFRGDSRANIKIILNPKRRKIISSLQKQFKFQDYLALDAAYEKLLEQQFTESNTTIDFDKTQQLIGKAIGIAKTLMHDGQKC